MRIDFVDRVDYYHYVNGFIIIIIFPWNRIYLSDLVSIWDFSVLVPPN